MYPLKEESNITVLTSSIRGLVRLESEKIAHHSKTHLEKSRKRIEMEIEEKFRRIERNRLHQIQEWRAKTADNPLRPDQYRVEMRREHLHNLRSQLETRELNRENLVKSLTGDIDVFHDICPPRRIHNLTSTDDKHAMEYRHKVMHAKELQRETKILKNIIEDHIQQFHEISEHR